MAVLPRAALSTGWLWYKCTWVCVSSNHDESHVCVHVCRNYAAACMTDRLAALELLADEDSPARAAALQHFHDTYSSQPLAMLKWLYVQVGGWGERRGQAGMYERLGCTHKVCSTTSVP